MKFRLIDSSDPFWKIAKDYAENCSWRAGKNLAFMMDKKICRMGRVIVATNNNSILGYCTVQKEDCIPDLTYTPYISCIFVDEKYRGKRLGQRMIEFAGEYLKHTGFDEVYLVSDHENLYEKYGFEVVDRKQAPWGNIEKIYNKKL